MNKVPAENFVKTLAANADNGKIDDKAFRQFVRNTLPIVEGSDYKEGTGFSRGSSDQRSDGNCQQRR
jgi:hypothetical protein